MDTAHSRKKRHGGCEDHKPVEYHFNLNGYQLDLFYRPNRPPDHFQFVVFAESAGRYCFVEFAYERDASKMFYLCARIGIDDAGKLEDLTQLKAEFVNPVNGAEGKTFNDQLSQLREISEEPPWFL